MLNSEYWQKRLEKLTNSLMLSQERNTVTFLKAYKSSLTEVQAYINLLYSKYSTDGVLSLADMYKFNRYTNMEKQITLIIDELGKTEKAYFTNELKKTYINSYVKTGAILNEGIPNLAINFALVPTNAIEKALTYPWSGADFSSRIYKNKDILITNLKQTLTKGFVEGKSITNMTKDLKGVMDIGATNARRLIRTESMHIMASSHHDAYKAAGVKQVQFLTAKDDRVCDECDAMDGEIFDIDDAPMLPIHPNGRSQLTPYFED